MTSTLVWDAGTCVVCTKPIELEGRSPGYFSKEGTEGFDRAQLFKKSRYGQTCEECNPALRCSWWNPACNCLWSCLPDDVMVTRVFCFLDVRELAKCCRVSRRWEALCKRKSLYKHVDMSSIGRSHHWDGTNESEGLISILNRHGRTALSTIKLCGLQRLSSQSLEFLGRLAINLRQLHFCNILTLHDEALITVFRNCHNLVDLQCPGCLFITDQALGYAASTNLQTLNLARCKVTIRGLERMLGDGSRVATSLRSLNIGHCPNLGATAVTFISQHLKPLQELNLNSVEFGGPALRALATGCTALRVLDISADSFLGNDSITDNDIKVLSKLQKLKRLDMEGLTEVTNSSIVHILNSLPSLEVLNIGGCASIEFTPKLHRALEESQLHGLTLAGTDVEVAAVATLSRMALRSLDLNGCDRLTPDILGHLERGFLTLRRLDIALCSGISKEHVESLRRARPELEVVYY